MYQELLKEEFWHSAKYKQHQKTDYLTITMLEIRIFIISTTKATTVIITISIKMHLI